MNYYDVLYNAANNAGVSVSEVGERLGKTRGYIPNAKTRGSMPSVTNAAAQLATVGYALVAVPVDQLPQDALTIDAPPISDDERAAAVERKRAALLRELDRLDAGGLLG